VFDASLEENNIKLYIDGELVNQHTWNHIVHENDANIIFGGFDESWNGLNGGANSSFFDGKLDNISVWNSPLSQEEIQNILDFEINSDEESLVGYWKFNAGIGDILYDHSGNGNHGTINGATWIENIYGCTDGLACNYDEDAMSDDGSCQYAEDNYDCEGNCISNLDCNGDCGGDDSSCIDEGFYSLSFNDDDFVSVSGQNLPTFDATYELCV
jgi:hypothetical protein